MLSIFASDEEEKEIFRVNLEFSLFFNEIAGKIILPVVKLSTGLILFGFMLPYLNFGIIFDFSGICLVPDLSALLFDIFSK